MKQNKFVNYNICAQTYKNYVICSCFLFLPKMMSQFNISLHRPTLNELYPTSKAAVLIQVTIPSLFSNPIYLNVSTFAVTEDNSLVIESVSIYSTSDGVLCTSVDEPFQMNNDFYQYRKYVIVDFVNTADTPEYLYLLVNLRVDQNTKFGKIHAVAAESNNRTVEYKVSLNSPMVLHDTEGIISSGLNKIVDGNYTSCIKLPRQGERPPWFWLTLSVLWLKIAPKPFQVTVVGDQISCKPHGQNLIQVDIQYDAPCSIIISNNHSICMLKYQLASTILL